MRSQVLYYCYIIINRMFQILITQHTIRIINTFFVGF